MNNLTDRQKAAIYDDAVQELRERRKNAKEEYEDYINKCRLSRVKDEESAHSMGIAIGKACAYEVALDLLTAPVVVDYAKRTWKDTAYNILGYGCLLGAFALLYFGVKFTLELYGLI